MSGILQRYKDLLVAGELQPDADQRASVEHLASLQSALEAERKSGFFARLIGSAEGAPAGIYMWGGVGRGKYLRLKALNLF